MGKLDDPKKKWLQELAAMMGGTIAAPPPMAAAPPQKQDSAAQHPAMPGLASSTSARASPGQASAAPGGPVAPGAPTEPGAPIFANPPDSIWNPYPAGSVFAPPPGPAQPPPVSADGPLDGAISTWTQTRSQMAASLGQLKAAILAAFVGEAPALVADLQKKVAKLDDLTKAFDQSLGDSLAKAKTAKDPAARKKEMVAAAAILAKFRGQVKLQEKFMAKVDTNPFGVKVNLKQQINASLEQVAHAIR